VIHLEWDKALSTNFIFYFEVVMFQFLLLNDTYKRGNVVLNTDVRCVVEVIKCLALILHLYLKRECLSLTPHPSVKSHNFEVSLTYRDFSIILFIKLDVFVRLT
jgi:hypothetical protein